MRDFVKGFRENIGAVVTAIFLLLIVSYYIFHLVPQHKIKLDDYNRDLLNEFGKQVELTFKDYANRLDSTVFNHSGVKYDGSQKIETVCPSEKITPCSCITDSVPFYNPKRFWELKINSVNIEDISISDKLLSIRTQVRLTTNKEQKQQTKVCVVQNVPVTEIKERLTGAIHFKSWLVYFPFDTLKHKIAHFAHNLEFHEYDSLLRTKVESKHYSFQNTEKRFYKKTIQLRGTNKSVVLVGAVDSGEFDSEARSMDVSDGVVGIVLVLLLFLCIPLVKPIISSKNESLTQVDLVNTVVCVWLTAIVLSLFVCSSFLRQVNASYIDENLKSYSDTLKTRMKDIFDEKWEYLDRYREQLNRLSTELDGRMKVDPLPLQPKKSDSDKKLQKKSDFNALFIMNKDGYMIKEIRMHDTFSLIKNYRDRDYFIKIFENDTNQVFSSVFSKTSNKFELVLVKRDAHSNNHIVGVSFNSKSIEDYRGPHDYGYMICNKEGRVLLHSDKSRRLNENFLAITHYPYEVLKILRGNDNVSFRLNYNNDPFAFHCLNFGRATTGYSRISPLYIITFKKLAFEEQLDLYSIVYSLSLSLGYLILLSLFLIIYSIVFHYKHLSIFSRTHLYWLFPDISRQNEYKFLQVINFLAIPSLILLCLWRFEHSVYLSMVLGLNLGFFNFVILSQKQTELRSFVLGKPGFVYLVLAIFGSVIISWLLYKGSLTANVIPITFGIHILYIIFYLRKGVSVRPAISESATRIKAYNTYKPYLWSKLLFHNVTIPIVLITFLFNQEIIKSEEYNISEKCTWRETYGNRAECEKCKPDDYWNHPIDHLQDLFRIEPPSKNILIKTDFNRLVHTPRETFNSSIFTNGENRSKFILVLVSLVLSLLAMYQLLRFYSGRFFFFELSEFYDHYKANANNTSDQNIPPANPSVITPPFSFTEFQSLYQKEGPLEKKLIDVYEGMYNSGESPTYKVVDMVIQDCIAKNYKHYARLWHDLNREEKFVLHDFAIDYFVNYKNRITLMKLIRSGYIIADPLTGRLRLFNYSFRKFVIEYEQKDPVFTETELEFKQKGAFARWRLPLLIIAISVLLVVIIVFNKSFNNLLILSGSVFSTIALVARFLNNYKR